DWFPRPEGASRFAFVTGDKNNLDIHLGDAAEPKKSSVPLVAWPSVDYQPVFSPDGKDLAFISTKDRSPGADLYVILDVDRQLLDPGAELAPVRLTNTQSEVRNPAWSPDGRFLSVTLEASEGDTVN